MVGDADICSGMYLSGTIPTASLNGTSSQASLQTLSLARNFFSGTTGSLDEQTALRTLLLSSNKLTCEAVRLDEAAHLGKGLFQDPTGQALWRLGERLRRSSVFYDNPYEDAGATAGYNNTVLIFAGNTQVSAVILVWHLLNYAYPADQGGCIHT